MSTISHIDHIAIAVKSIEEVRNFYELSLGLAITQVEEMPERGIRVAFIRLGPTTIELIEPLHANSEISSFLEKKGPGLHHIAFSSKDISAQEATLKKNGVKLIYDQPKPGAHNTLVNFIHPKESRGALIELVQGSQNERGC